MRLPPVQRNLKMQELLRGIKARSNALFVACCEIVMELWQACTNGCLMQTDINSVALLQYTVC